MHGICGGTAWADKFEVSVGGYLLSAKVATGSQQRSGSSANLGVYHLEYRRPFGSRFEFGLGYTLLMSNTVGGDLGYGLDVSGYYYPFGGSENFVWKNDQSRVSIVESWRPFVGLTFGQRQFLGSGFAGFGGLLGVEHPIYKSKSLVFETGYRSLAGSGGVSLSEFDFMLGFSLSFDGFH
ncbi:hypothetical protein EBZ37_01775 [bacterium]|nr:hypothetical protein [bacterium]